jgi:transposase
MRGDERFQDGMFSYVSLEQRVPSDHPLRAVRKLTDVVLRRLSPEFDALYANSGRPSIAPEYILRALLLQVFYSVRSERLLVEQISYNLLFRWFVGLGMDDAVWNHAVFSKNRDRLLNSEVAQSQAHLPPQRTGSAAMHKMHAFNKIEDFQAGRDNLSAHLPARLSQPK